MKANPNRTLLKIPSDIPCEALAKTLRNTLGDDRSHLNRTRQDRTRSSSRKPILSLVCRNVDTSRTEKEFEDILIDENFLATRSWRIISRRQGKPTSMFRFLTESETAYRFAVTKGIRFHGLSHPSEASNPTNPVPAVSKYCNRCSSTGHLAESCEAKPVCPSYGASDHKSTICPKANDTARTPLIILGVSSGWKHRNSHKKSRPSLSKSHRPPTTFPPILKS